MSNHVEYGTARGALYTLTPSDDIESLAELGILTDDIDDDDETRAPLVLGLWNENGDGVALEGTRDEILHYLRLAVAHVEQHAPTNV